MSTKSRTRTKPKFVSNFATTAAYYDRYRPGVPEQVVKTVLGAVVGRERLLDLGTGTGRILEQFAPHFSDIIAVEPDTAMLELARKRLAHYPIQFLPTTAEDAQLPTDWQAQLVTICRAFHWMDRPAVLRKLAGQMAPNGVLALISDNSFWHIKDEWSDIARTTLQECTGPGRQTITGTFLPPGEFFRLELERSAFQNIREHTVLVTRQWTIDEIIGYLYSTSFASKAVLGAKAPAFESTLRERLAQLLAKQSADTFTEHNQFEITLASRPR